MARNPSLTWNGFVHGGRVVSGFALAGSVITGLTLGSIPALAAIDMHLVGAGVGIVIGLVVNARYAF